MVGVDGVSWLGPVDCEDADGECEGDEQPATNNPRAATSALVRRAGALPASVRAITGSTLVGSLSGPESWHTVDTHNILYPWCIKG